MVPPDTDIVHLFSIQYRQQQHSFVVFVSGGRCCAEQQVVDGLARLDKPLGYANLHVLCNSMKFRAGPCFLAAELIGLE